MIPQLISPKDAAALLGGQDFHLNRFADAIDRVFGTQQDLVGPGAGFKVHSHRGLISLAILGLHADVGRTAGQR